MAGLGVLLALGAPPGCKKGEEPSQGTGASPAAAPPSKPATGAPVAFEVVKIVSRETLEVRVYNFSASTVADYGLVIRFRDAGGAVLKPNPGKPLEKDFMAWAVSGPAFKCAPQQWCSFKLDHLDVPAGAASGEVLATFVRALAKDGVMFEKEPLFDMPHTLHWPGPEKP